MNRGIRRRSGYAVVEYLDLLGWRPKVVYMVGVGTNHEEIHVMRELWKDKFALYAYEPHPDIYKSLARPGKDQFGFPGIIREYAISNFTGVGQLYTKPSWKDGSSLIPKTKEPEQYKSIPVEVTTLDKLKPVMPADAPGLLWLDCEGSELAALQGGVDLISEMVQVINIEQTARPRGDNWPTPYETHMWLTAHDFLQAWTHTNRTVIGQYDSIYLKNSLFREDHCSCLESITRYKEWLASI